MSKTIAKAALVVGAVAAIASGVGALGGAGLLGAGFAGTAATLTTIGTYAGIAAAGLTAVAAFTAKKPSAQATGSQTSFAADPDAPIPYVIGCSAPHGDVVWRESGP